jgi:hypothetical protein
MDSVTDDSTKPEASQGRFLLSLDSELPQSDFTIDSAIRLYSLFSRRVCLPDSHLIDTPTLQAFFKSHEAELQEEVDQAAEGDRPPMLGTLSRGGADIGAALDLMLTPNERTGLPTYFSRLRPELNARFREAVSGADTTEQRRTEFLKIAGPGLERHLVRTTKYFQKSKLAVVPRCGDPQDELFEAVREQIVQIQQPWNARWLSEADKSVCEALLKEMDANPKAQTRERLHLAIYGGDRLPHYYQGAVQLPAEGDELRHPWRHLVNTFYGCNLAKKYSCSPALNSKWFNLPSCLSIAEASPNLDRLERAGTVEVAPLYLEHLTIPFISNVRAQNDFWVSLEHLERASVERNGTKYCAALKEHLRFLSATFSEHLINRGHRDLVKTKVVDLWYGNLQSGIGLSTVILGGVAAWIGLPAESFWNVMAESAKIAGVTLGVVTGLLKKTEIELPSPEFKAFEISLRRISS